MADRIVDAERVVIARTLRGVWPSLPALTCASAAVCVASVVPVVVAPGVNPVAIAVAAVTVTPFAAALVAIVNELVGDDVATIRSWLRSLRALWRFAVAEAAVPAGAATLLLAAVEVRVATGSPWVLPSLAVSGAGTVIAVFALMAALPLGAAHDDLRGRALWLASIALVARRPTRFVAVASVIGVGIWAATTWSASLLLFVPAPAAIVAVTATWTSALDARART